MIATRTIETLPNSANNALTFCEPDTLVAGFALVVCTYKRMDSLKRFLDSLADQEHKPDQLIIVDASPTDETEQMLRAYRDVESLADHMLYFRVGEPFRGL